MVADSPTPPSTSSDSTGPPEKKVALRAQLAQQLVRESHKPMKKSMFVVRPAPLTAAARKEPFPPVPPFGTQGTGASSPGGGSTGNQSVTSSHPSAVISDLVPVSVTSNGSSSSSTASSSSSVKKEKSEKAEKESTEPPQDLLILNKAVVLPIFSFLSHSDLALCAAVCKTWAQLSIDPSLWTRMNLTGKHLTAHCLNGIVRRQPRSLILDWTAIAKRQLAWLVVRLPQLKELSLQGCSYMGVAALRTCTCPPLLCLDLSFVNGMNDASLRDILSPPQDSRPGLHDTKSRLRNLTTLKLAGCDITDISLRYIVQNIPQLSHLDMSHCTLITNLFLSNYS
uniref:JmjC domain-containing histone demethylation protein 1 n=2 Tax=Cacopsylla melanoneura TaxID=428564 RepID=A0A8D8M5C2_9HEMI